MSAFKKLPGICVVFTILAGCLLFPRSVWAADAADSPDKAVVFVLDTSGSMDTNDPDRLAIDSISQLVYSLPSDYRVGVVGYNTSVGLNTKMVSAQNRQQLISEVEKAEYRGYSHAGAGLETAIQLLEQNGASQNTIILLSDGEILMGDPDQTQESAAKFQTATARANELHIPIHTIGLGEESAADPIISGAAAATGGAQYHAPKAGNIQQAIDAILLEQMGIKKMTVATLESNGNPQPIQVDLPFQNASMVRVLITCDSPITNLTADFHANGGKQISGLRYALIELDRPTAQEISLQFQGESGSKLKIEIIPEYAILASAATTYQDRQPEDPEALSYERDSLTEISFSRADNPSIAVFEEEYFDHAMVQLVDAVETIPQVLSDGKIQWEQPVTQEVSKEIRLDFTDFPVNILGEPLVSIAFEAPPLLSQPNYLPYFLIGGAVVAAAGCAVGIWFLVRKKKATTPVTPPAPSKYSYVGRLNIYITRTPSGADIPPLSFNLFRLSSGRTVSLQEILTQCEVTEPLKGAERIFFQPGMHRSLILSNQSDCTIIKSREILLKQKSYTLVPESKVDITFEDETSELAFQYKDT